MFSEKKSGYRPADKNIKLDIIKVFIACYKFSQKYIYALHEEGDSYT